MLQFIARINNRYSVAELAQMAIEGGCQWVELDLPDASDDFIRATALELKDLCMETGTFLTIADRPDIAREAGLHGVRLHCGMAAKVAAIRDELGAEAIIGVDIHDASDIIKVQNLDIDYAVLPSDITTEKAADIIGTVRKSEIMLPIVACGKFSPDEAIEIIVAGASGIAVSSAIADADDPVESTRLLLEALAATKS